MKQQQQQQQQRRLESASEWIALDSETIHQIELDGMLSNEETSVSIQSKNPKPKPLTQNFFPSPPPPPPPIFPDYLVE